MLMLPLIMLSTCAVRNVGSYEAMRLGEEITDGVKTSSRLWELLFGDDAVPASAVEERRVIVGGDVFGARIYQGYISVCEDCDAIGIRRGDIIKAIDNRPVLSLGEVRGMVELSGGACEITVQRGSKTVNIKLSEEDWGRFFPLLRDGAAGIGTITYIDPENMSFGGLGHGICDDTGATIPSAEGVVTGVIIGGVHRGERGQPGELTGVLTDKCSGKITLNSSEGVFGVFTAKRTDKGTTLPIAKGSEVKEGAATVVCTVKNGKKAEYSVEIFDVKPSERGTKCFKIRVTDKALLALTGGIVRGMSGSPIIQDGKLVGAVTHVMVANPTEGYGIFIENMLNAAQSQVQPKAA